MKQNKRGGWRSENSDTYKKQSNIISQQIANQRIKIRKINYKTKAKIREKSYQVGFWF